MVPPSADPKTVTDDFDDIPAPSFTDIDLAETSPPEAAQTCVVDPNNEDQTFNLVTQGGDFVYSLVDHLGTLASNLVDPVLGPLLGQQPPTSFHFLQNPIGFPYVESFDLVTDGPNGPQFVAVGFDGSFTLVDHSTGPFPQDLVGEGFVTTSVFTVDCDGFVLVYTQPPLIDVLDPTYPLGAAECKSGYVVFPSMNFKEH
ncbi:uncharacterized protein LTHEOB_2193 [Neofusicoccum parvum]|nr:uncharacterized protein LTHEOB_2193 [Neofusicoccum parvum]